MADENLRTRRDIYSGQGNQTYVAPPPAEFSIRTMASDIESLKESGGLRFEAKKVTLQTDTASFIPPAVQKVPAKFIFWIVAGLAAAAVLFFAGYYFLPLFLR